MKMHTPKDHTKNRLCIIPLCKNERFDLVHKFPMDNQRMEEWRAAINLPEINNLSFDLLRKRTICSKHFRKEDYKNVESRCLNKTAVPSLNFRSSGVVESGVHEGLERGKRSLGNATSNTNDGGHNQMACKISIQSTSSNSMMTTSRCIKFPFKRHVNTTTAHENSRKYHRKSYTNSSSTLINLEGPFSKYRLVQLTPMEAAETQLNTLPVAGDTEDNYVSVLINDLTSVPKSVTSIDSAREMDFVTTETKVNIVDVQYLNEIIEMETIEPCYVKMLDDSFIIKTPNFPEPLTFNTFWLRDHCSCFECYNQDTKQRKICFLDIPVDIKPSDFSVDGNELQITWPDNHRSVYDIVKLSSNTYEKHKTFVELKDLKILWNAESIKSLAYARVSFADYLSDANVAKKLVSSLITYGVAFVENVPANILTTEVSIKRLFDVHKTFFGEIWSFDDKKVHNDNAYTREYLAAHTDNMYFNDAAGVQVLHCLSHTGQGGDTLLVDGFNVLNNLKTKDETAFKRLCTTNVESEYIDEGRHHTYIAPIVKLHPLTQQPEQIRFNAYDRSIMRSIPMTEMSTFYKDMHNLASNIQSPLNEWWFKLEPGTVVFFDNWRILHGRSSYTGNRQMAGGYVSRTEFLSVARTMNLIS